MANYLVGRVSEDSPHLIDIGQPKISKWMKGHVRMALRHVA